MKAEEYDSLVQNLAVTLNAVPHIEQASKEWRIPYDQLAAACAQITQQMVIQSHGWLRLNTSNLVDRYTAGESLQELACAFECPPCLLARRLLESLPGIEGRQRSTKLLRKPSLLELAAPASPEGDEEGEQDSRHATSALLSRLKDDIIEAAQLDTLYSPQSDIVRHISGIEYEALLCEKLVNAGVPFFSEDNLREQGFFKTPDIKLQVPIMVHGRILNWIDSKATFGSRHAHMLQRKAQYMKYVNRFGPGLVIYWFGFIDDLAELDTDIMLLDHFPDPGQIVQLPRLPVPGALLVQR